MLKIVAFDGAEIFKIKGFKWRIAVSIVLPFIAIIFLICWFWEYAEPYTVWQNIAVLLVTLLIIGGVLGAIWARWGMKHGHEMGKFDEIGEEIGKKVEEAFKDKKEEESKDLNNLNMAFEQIAITVFFLNPEKIKEERSSWNRDKCNKQHSCSCTVTSHLHCKNCCHNSKKETCYERFPRFAFNRARTNNRFNHYITSN